MKRRLADWWTLHVVIPIGAIQLARHTLRDEIKQLKRAAA